MQITSATLVPTNNENLLTNGSLAALLDRQYVVQKASIKIIKDAFSQQPWGSDDESLSFKQFVQFTKRNWKPLLVNAVALGSLFAYNAYSCWSHPKQEPPTPQTQICLQFNNDCTGLFKFNLSECQKGDDYGLYYTCPLEPKNQSLPHAILYKQNPVLLFENIIGDLFFPHLFTWFENGVSKKVTNAYKSLKLYFSIAKLESFIKDFKLQTHFCHHEKLSNSVYPTLCKMDLIKSTRRQIVHSMNISQLLRLKETTDPNNFKSFTKGVLKPHQQLALLFFQECESYSERDCKIALTKLKEFMELDPTIWVEAVEAVKKYNLNSNDIEEYLTNIGKRIGFLLPDSTNLRDSVSFVVFIEKEIIPLKSVNVSKIIKYDYFESYVRRWINETGLVYKFQANTEAQVNAYKKLLEFIENDEVELNNKLVIELLPIANELGINECVYRCYRYLIAHENEFEMKFFFDLLFTHAIFDGSRKELIVVLKEKMKKTIDAKAAEETLNDILEIAKKHLKDDEIKADLAIDLKHYIFTPLFSIEDRIKFKQNFLEQFPQLIFFDA